MSNYGLLLAFLVLCVRASAETILVSAAASLTDALGEIGKMYEARSPDLVNFNFGASSLLARQVEASAPVDVFFSADEALLDRLEKQNLLAGGTRRSILSNTLVVVVPEDSALAMHSARALASAGVHSVALAEPASVPAGIYAREYLQKLGIWEEIRPKVIPTENVRGALAAVESGNADAAIVYRTDAGISKSVRVAFEVPAAEGPRISYPAAVVRGSRHAEAAKKFLSFLESAAASEVFRRYGFLLTGKVP
jgi:molybdate transport system substrate-binding protein